ncbi:MAG: hypothetical protein EKK37_17395 [Sphingobacteriales bacterium]|nr:MAG: hypothetical protein EKK37_17395 [Sphingobacteriales bacterium]
MFRKRYYLLFLKSFGEKDLKKPKIGMPMYRSDGRFYYGPQLMDECLMYGWQAYCWYYTFKLFGKRYNKKLFAYKNPNGIVIIQKIY